MDAETASESSFDETAAMPGHLLRRCQQIAVSLFLKECRDVDLTPLQYAALTALEQYGELDQVTLGGLTALDRTTVGVVLRKLEARGLVTRRRSESDRRAKTIAITDAGRALTGAARPHVRAMQDRLMAPLSAAERAQLLDMLGRIAETHNAESRAPARPL